MEDKVAALIRSLAKLQIRIAKTSHQSLRESFENDFREKILKLEKFIPAEQKRSIDKFIDRETARIEKEDPA